MGKIIRWLKDKVILSVDNIKVKEGISYQEETLPEIIQQAKRDWDTAKVYYNNVSDTDLIDHAVYLLQAAEKKYIYLIKKAKAEGITYSPYGVKYSNYDS